MARRGRVFWLGVAALGAAALAPRQGLGRVNPADPGLPRVVLMWGTTFDGRHGSSLCVACHTENPSARIPGPTVLPVGDTEPLYRGSHFMRNRLDGIDRFTAPAKAQPVPGGWEKVTAWATGGLSKYAVGTTSVIGAPGELICESCHNLVMNAGSKQLLDSWNRTTGAVLLCGGCHAGVTGSQHHPLGAVNITDRGGVRNLPIDQANNYVKTDGVRYFPPPNTVTCVSCHKPHDAQTATGARVLRRGASQVTSVSSVFEKAVNVLYYDNAPVTGLRGQVIARKPAAVVAVTGLHRQGDMDDARPLVVNGDPLCDACHKYND